ncbi:MAG: hypothetical protein NW223_11795, partial [Hyphomicrobiaceae bacterium]|nr:hypothetical protein [Hyphomicrobiaceae bacterium]
AWFGLTGRPRYLALVKHWPSADSVLAGLARRGLEIVVVRYYGASLLPLRWLGDGHAGASQFVVAARRPPPQA